MASECSHEHDNIYYNRDCAGYPHGHSAHTTQLAVCLSVRRRLCVGEQLRLAPHALSLSLSPSSASTQWTRQQWILSSILQDASLLSLILLPKKITKRNVIARKSAGVAFTLKPFQNGCSLNCEWIVVHDENRYLLKIIWPLWWDYAISTAVLEAFSKGISYISQWK